MFVLTGSYCIYKSKDVLCPKDMDTGWVRWDDEDDRNKIKKEDFYQMVYMIKYHNLLLLSNCWSLV